jgi:hypothetical protein
MKTLVIFALPDDTCRTCYLDERALTPYPGHRYLFGGKLYEVAEMTEVLELVDGNSQYLALLDLISGGAESGGAPPRMISLSEADKGKIVLAGAGDRSGLVDASQEHVLLVRLTATKPPGGQTLGSLLKLGQTTEAKRLVADDSGGQKKKRRGRRGRRNGAGEKQTKDGKSNPITRNSATRENQDHGG